MSCGICINDFNKSTRCEVKCDFCEFSSCRECSKKYLLSLDLNAHCMSCKREWDRKILVSKFEGTFVNKAYKQHREKVLMDRERSLLPATQPYVEREIECEKIDVELGELQEEINKLAEKMSSLRAVKRRLESKESTVRKNFVRKCPRENCKGFLSSQWKCGLCEHYTCNECNEVKGVTKDCEHTCKPENVATVQLLAKDTKPCPGCGAGIFKIEGCDQMFCIECHTAFSWKTGCKVFGAIHNPHYFEYLRRAGHVPRNPNEVRCGRELDHTFAAEFMGRDRCEGRKIMENICRQLIHIRHVELPRFNVNNINENLDLRVAFMRDKLTEDEFKRRVQQREKSVQKRTDLQNILNMLLSCATEIMYRYAEQYNQTRKKETFSYAEWIMELDNLRVYTNDCLKDVSEVYKCKKYALDKNFKMA